MKLAPIQLVSLSFRRVSIELDIKRFSDSNAPAQESPFDFENVLIATHVGFAPMEGEASPRPRFLLTLHVVVDNAQADDPEHARSPYLLDIEAGAVVEVAPGAEALEHIEDVAVVNGTSLLWSAIREQVSTLTCRMPAGLAMLPTVHFLDLKSAQRSAEKPTASSGPRKGGSRPRQAASSG